MDLMGFLVLDDNGFMSSTRGDGFFAGGDEDGFSATGQLQLLNFYLKMIFRAKFHGRFTGTMRDDARDEFSYEDEANGRSLGSLHFAYVIAKYEEEALDFMGFSSTLL
ncbi:hypothetical protein ACLOJK_030456 [Asimina triloba]